MRIGIIALAVMASVVSARAESVIVPFAGADFGGDAAGCGSLPACHATHANIGVSLAVMWKMFGLEEDVSFAPRFLGDAVNADNEVFAAMTNVIVRAGTGRLQPYLVGGAGVIRPRVSTPAFSGGENAFGVDIGGGVSYFPDARIGIRGDLRRLQTTEDINLLIFSGERLGYWRGSVGVAVKF